MWSGCISVLEQKGGGVLCGQGVSVYCGRKEAVSCVVRVYQRTVAERRRCPVWSGCISVLLLRFQGTASRSTKTQLFRCPQHGEYRMYQDSLVAFKSWCILWVTLALVPFGLLVHAAGLDLNWVILTGCIVTIPCFPGVVLSLLWVKASAVGLAVGESSSLWIRGDRQRDRERGGERATNYNCGSRISLFVVVLGFFGVFCLFLFVCCCFLTCARVGGWGAA